MTATDRQAPVFADAVGELASRELLPADTLVVFVAGSMARGWDNETSDVDLYVVSATPWTGPTGQSISAPVVPEEVPVEAFRAGGRRWEAKYWVDTQVDQILAKVGWDALEDGRLPPYRLVKDEVLLLERICHGVTVLGPEWTERRRAEVWDSALRAVLVASELDLADSRSEDALGQLAAGDLDSAVLSARLAFGFTVEALLASLGEFGSGEKWRARRMRAAKPDVLPYDLYWEIETMRGLDPEDVGVWVRRVVSECKRITREVDV